MLEKLGHTVVLACDGLVAQQILQGDEQFDLVLSDWMMPGLDGIELTRWIRQSRGDSLKVVIMTGLEGAEASQYALRCGADGFLRKPLRQEELARRLSLIVGDDPFLDELEPTSVEEAPVRVPAKSARHCLLVTTTGAQAPFARQLAKDFAAGEYPGTTLVLMGPEVAPVTFDTQLREGGVHVLPPGHALECTEDGCSLVADERPWERTHRSLARHFRRGCQALMLDAGAGDWDAYMGASYVVAARGHVILLDTQQPHLQELYDNFFSTGVPVELVSDTALLSTSRQIARYQDELAASTAV